MALKVYVVDDVSGDCALRRLVPYTGVTSNDSSVTVVQSAGIDGQPLYDISVDSGAVSEVTPVATGLANQTIAIHNDGLGTITLIEESVTKIEPDGFGGFNHTSENGTVVNMPPASPETITTLTPDGSGGLNYTNEAGSVVNIPASSSSSSSVRTISTTSDALLVTDKYVIIDDDAAGALVTIDLPTAAGNSGLIYIIKKKGSTANVVIDANGAQTIDGALTATLTVQYEAISIFSDGAEWWIY